MSIRAKAVSIRPITTMNPLRKADEKLVPEWHRGQVLRLNCQRMLSAADDVIVEGVGQQFHVVAVQSITNSPLEDHLDRRQAPKGRGQPVHRLGSGSTALPRAPP